MEANSFDRQDLFQAMPVGNGLERLRVKGVCSHSWAPFKLPINLTRNYWFGQHFLSTVCPLFVHNAKITKISQKNTIPVHILASQ